MSGAGIPEPDYPAIKRELADFLDSCLERTGTEGFVLGMSGGVDSAALAYLACVRHRNKTLGVIMPDASVTPDSETDDGRYMAGALGMESRAIKIDGIVGAYAGQLGNDERALGNLRARVRGTILYYHANSNNRLVLGSTDRSEYLLGYYTKYGDGAADVTPLVRLYKTHVRGLARHLGVPDRVVEKKSSPHLWAGHDAEAEIGMPYEMVDRILHHAIDLRMTPGECSARTGIPVEAVSRILGMVEKNRHKREAPDSPRAAH